MANRAQFNVGTEYAAITAGLPLGSAWRVQNVGSSQVEWCRSPNAAAALLARPQICPAGAAFNIVAGADPVWARTARGNQSALAIAPADVFVSRSEQVDLADGETIALDMADVDFGWANFGWNCIAGAGATVTHRAANAPRPAAADWIAPATNGTISASVLVQESTPIGWLRFASAGGAATIAYSGRFAELRAHSSADHQISAAGLDMPDIDDLRVGSKRTIQLANYFDYAHPDVNSGASVHYEASSADATKVSASVSGDELTLTGVAEDTDVEITVTATAPHGGTATQNFDCDILANRAPVSNGPENSTYAVEVGKSISVPVAGYFRDPDSGQSLTITAVSATPANATVLATGNIVRVAGVAVGTSAITVTATDPAGASATWRFTISVKAATSNHARQTRPIINARWEFLQPAGNDLNLDLSQYFSAGSAHSLIFHDIASSDPSIVSVSVHSDGHTITLTPHTAGTVHITFTVGTDLADLPAARAQGSFQAIVASTTARNRAPFVSQPFPSPITVHGEHPHYSIDLADYFSDADGDILHYSGRLTGSVTGVSVNVSGSTGTVQFSTGEIAVGSTVGVQVEWKATDPDGLSAVATQVIQMRAS